MTEMLYIYLDTLLISRIYPLNHQNSEYSKIFFSEDFTRIIGLLFDLSGGEMVTNLSQATATMDQMEPLREIWTTGMR